MLPIYTVTNTRAAVDKIKYCERTHTYKKGYSSSVAHLPAPLFYRNSNVPITTTGGWYSLDTQMYALFVLCSAEEWINEVI